MSVTITSATGNDIPTLCGLLNILFTQEAEFAPNEAAQCRGLDMIITNPEVGTILVARENNTIVGMVNLLCTVSTALGARVALLEDMVVAPAARGKGVGSLLLQHAVEWARSQGCKRITLLTDGDNEEAKRFYQAQGFATSKMVPMRLVINK